MSRTETRVATTQWSEQRRQAILEAAIEVFLTEGSRANLDVIATRAGASKATIYTHFGTKDGLFRASVRAKSAEVAREFDQLTDMLVVPQSPTPEAIFELFVAFGEKWYALSERPEVAALQRVIFAEADERPELLDEWNTAVVPGFDRLGAVLERFQAAGALDIEDTRRAGWQLSLLVGGEAWFRINLLRDLDRAALSAGLRDNVRLFVRAYGKRA